MKSLRLLTLGLLAGACTLQAQLIGLYEFNGNLNDTQGNLPSLVPYNHAASSYSAGVYSFSALGHPGSGLVLDVPLAELDPEEYSIGLRFSFSDLNGYNKIIDFKDLGSDLGLYYFNDNLNFYYFDSGALNVTANDFYDVILTRTKATGEVSGFINSLHQFSFIDSSQAGVPTQIAGASRFRFFHDDGVTSGEWTDGRVDEIRLWQHVLSQSEISDAFTSSPVVPEPRSLAALALFGLGAFHLLRRRRAAA